MAKVRFTKDFDYKPSAGTTVGYLAGMELTVKRECFDQAIAAGKAVAVGRRPPVQEVRDGEAENGG